MTLHISISKDAEARLRQIAAAGARPLEEVAAHLLEDAVNRPSLAEVLAPVRAEFEASGLSEEQLGDLLERAKHELRSEPKAS